MFRFFKVASCIGVVSSAMQKMGMSKIDARALVDSNTVYFNAVFDILEHVEKTPRNVIVTIVLLHKTEIELGSSNLILNECLKQSYDSFKYQLKISPNWREIAIGLYTAMHLILGEDLPTEAEIIEKLEPSKLTF